MAQRTCSIEGCEKPARQRGWCGTHYSRWRRTGDVGPVGLIPERYAGKECSVASCDRTPKANGMCFTHYGNLKSYGHAIPVRDWSLEDRLAHAGWDVTAAGCWEWRGSRNEHGYGLLTAPRLGLDGARVHRLMWEMHRGPIPDGLVVRHRCDNPPCVNPDHLEPGTQRENANDMAERGRSIAYATGRYGGVCKEGRHDVTRPGGLKLVTQKDRKQYYACTACDRDRKRRYAERKKAAL